MDINVTASQVDLDFKGVALKAGELVDESVKVPGGKWTRVALPLEAVTATEPAKHSTLAVIHCPPSELRRFCEDTLEKLDKQGP